MEGNWRLLVLATALAALVLSTTTVGLVTSGSMQPAIPQDSLFVAFDADPEVGDVVVYETPGGVEAAHRVVDRTDEGQLVTKGDANDATDQEQGIPPVDPDEAHVIPEVGGQPLAVSQGKALPVAVLAAQIGLLAWGLRGLLEGSSVSLAPAGLPELHAWHLFVLAGVVLLLAAPLNQQTLEGPTAAEVSAWALPTHVRVDDAGDVSHHTLLPLERERVAIEDEAEITQAPAVPGARELSHHGAAWATLPAVASLLAAGLAAREREVGPSGL